jgi:hypothetical protein
MERPGLRVSWLERLRQAPQAADDPWRPLLERLRGEIGLDNVERVTTQAALDTVGVAQQARGTRAYLRLARNMSQLGWAAVRMKGRTRGGYLEQVRGYARDARGRM